jgi:hypothetical protein
MSVFLINRESGETGDVFALLYHTNPGDKERFALSQFVIGKGVTIVKPQLEGEWHNMPIIWSPEPCLDSSTNWDAFLPTPFPELVSHIFNSPIYYASYCMHAVFNDRSPYAYVYYT